MTLKEFVALDASDQIAIAQQDGVKVAMRDHGSCIVHLYQLQNFYAEIFYRKFDFSIWKVGGFDHQIMLVPYLDQIDVRDIMGNSD